MKVTGYFLALSCVPVFASDPVDQTRLPYQGSWVGIVGVSNGIPNRQTIYTNFTSANTIGQINTGIVNCPSNQVVHLAAGTYTISGANLAIANNGVTVRGDVDANGNPTTILVFDATDFVSMQAVGDWNYDNPAEFSNIGGSSGFTRGSSSVTLLSTPTGLTPGTLMVITAPRNAPTIDGNPAAFFANWFPSSDNHPFSSGVKVTGVSGTTVSFWPPINADYISTTNVVHFRTLPKQLILSGIENLILTNTTQFFSAQIVDMQGADECWVKNCKMYGVGSGSSANAAVHFYCCFGCEVRHNWVQYMAAYSSSEYCIVSFQSWKLWVEDNVFFTVANIWPQVSTSDSAFTYNYMTNEQYVSATFLSQLEFNHGAHNSYNLNEGNWIPTHFSDLTASGNFSHSRNTTYFREMLPGWDGYGPKSVNAHCISLQNHHDNATVADCYMGHSGTQIQYEQTTGGVGGNNSIFNYDSGVSGTTLQRFGNWNIIDGGIHSGEGLSGGQAFVNSYIWPNKPSEFGILPWPPNPSAATATLIDPTNIPAGYRYTFGADPPITNLLGSTITMGSGVQQQLGNSVNSQLQ